jgi:hypothetical protein
MKTINRVVIAFSKPKLLLYLLFTIVFFCGGFHFFTEDPETIMLEKKWNNPFMVHSIGFLTMFFSGLIGFDLLKKIMSSSPAFIIDSRGITDNSSAFSIGYIPWSQITMMNVERLKGYEYVVIHIRDIKELKAARDSLLDRTILEIICRRRYLFKPGRSTMLSMLRLKISFAEFHSFMETGLAAYTAKAIANQDTVR